MTCVDCSCKRVGLHDDTCKELHEMNDSKVKGSSNVLADAELCDYPKIFPKIIYSIWCMFKNIIAVICWILARLKAIEDKINEMIDLLNKLCQTLKCVVEYLKKDAQAKMEEALGNVTFGMKSQGSAIGSTYTRVTTSNDGSFTINWNMISLGVGEVGKGTVKGKVIHSYVANTDGTIQANIAGFTIQSVNYVASGIPNPSGGASYTIKDNSGNVVWSKSYNPASSFSETPNKTIKYNISKKLSARGGVSGDIRILDTYDNWDTQDTIGLVYAYYENNNEPIVPFDCDIDCKTIEKLSAEKTAKDKEAEIFNAQG